MGGPHWHGWFTYLEEECQSEDGLLCFYDSPRSPKVVYLCEVLAENLASLGLDSNQN